MRTGAEWVRTGAKMRLTDAAALGWGNRPCPSVSVSWREASGFARVHFTNGKMKCGTPAWSFGFHPDFTTVAFHDTAAEREAEAGAGYLGAVKPLQGFKDGVLQPGWNPFAVVADREQPSVVRGFR